MFPKRLLPGKVRFQSLFTRRMASTLAIAACLLTGLATSTVAQQLPGFTLWGGVKPENSLNFRLDSGRANAWDRYRLRISAKKMKLAAAQLTISYPDYYNGTFDPKDIEVTVKGKKVDLQEVSWNKENRFIEIYPKAPLPAGEPVEIVLSNVKNPIFGGMYHFTCRVQTPGDVPLLRYLGTWLLSIN